MKTIPFCITLTLILLISCKSKNENSEKDHHQKPETETISAHNSQNSLDWSGIYAGTMPCDDCDGIKTKIELNQDLSYTKTVQHLEKSEPEETTSGTFSWDKSGNTISLNGAKKSSYKVGETILIPLDANGNQLSNKLEKVTKDE